MEGPRPSRLRQIVPPLMLDRTPMVVKKRVRTPSPMATPNGDTATPVDDMMPFGEGGRRGNKRRRRLRKPKKVVDVRQLVAAAEHTMVHGPLNQRLVCGQCVRLHTSAGAHERIYAYLKRLNRRTKSVQVAWLVPRHRLPEHVRVTDFLLGDDHPEEVALEHIVEIVGLCPPPELMPRSVAHEFVGASALLGLTETEKAQA